MSKQLRWLSLVMLAALALGLVGGAPAAQAQEAARPYIGVLIEQTAEGARVVIHQP